MNDIPFLDNERIHANLLELKSCRQPARAGPDNNDLFGKHMCRINLLIDGKHDWKVIADSIILAHEELLFSSFAVTMQERIAFVALNQAIGSVYERQNVV
jgi:hypothetical protein